VTAVFVSMCCLDAAGQLSASAVASHTSTSTTGRAGGARVAWNVTSVVAQQGDNVTLVCTVRSVDLFDVVRLTLTPLSDDATRPHTVDTHVHSAATGRRWTISDNEAVKAAFTGLQRYSVTMSVEGRRAFVTLQLTGKH